jgi:hypothetical protein
MMPPMRPIRSSAAPGRTEPYIYEPAVGCGDPTVPDIRSVAFAP